MFSTMKSERPERLGRNNSWDSDSIKSMVSRAASEQAKIFIQEHLTIKEAL